MLLWAMVACLVNRDLYEERLVALSDEDQDGFRPEDGDCDDHDDTIHPQATETCNNIDDDCNGAVDDDPIDQNAWYLDQDNDGFGAGEATWACTQPIGTVSDGTDCDDGNASTNPKGTEVPYDGIDQDCSGQDITDIDGDGGDAEQAGGDDCNDSDPTIFTGAPETWANGLTDNNCDGAREAITLEFGNPVWHGEGVEEHAGERVKSLGDMDGDGLEEFLVSGQLWSGAFAQGEHPHLRSWGEHRL